MNFNSITTNQFKNVDINKENIVGKVVSLNSEDLFTENSYIFKYSEGIVDKFTIYNNTVLIELSKSDNLESRKALLNYFKNIEKNIYCLISLDKYTNNTCVSMVLKALEPLTQLESNGKKVFELGYIATKEGYGDHEFNYVKNLTTGDIFLIDCYRAKSTILVAHEDQNYDGVNKLITLDDSLDDNIITVPEDRSTYDNSYMSDNSETLSVNNIFCYRYLCSVVINMLMHFSNDRFTPNGRTMYEAKKAQSDSGLLWNEMSKLLDKIRNPHLNQIRQHFLKLKNINDLELFVNHITSILLKNIEASKLFNKQSDQPLLQINKGDDKLIKIIKYLCEAFENFFIYKQRQKINHKISINLMSTPHHLIECCKIIADYLAIPEHKIQELIDDIV